jgi:hypothetical protein
VAQLVQFQAAQFLFVGLGEHGGPGLVPDAVDVGRAELVAVLVAGDVVVPAQSESAGVLSQDGDEERREGHCSVQSGARRGRPMGSWWRKLDRASRSTRDFAELM